MRGGGGGDKWFDGQLQHVTLILMQCGRCGPGGETDDSLITGLQSVLEQTEPSGCSQ